MAVVTRGSVSSLENSTRSLMSPRVWMATSAAFSNPSAMRTEWMPRPRSFSACSRRAPASTTTPVVPSPTSSSWEDDNSTMSLPTWLDTCIWPRMVAPSLVMVTSPSGLTMILSIPLGPSEVRTMPEMVRAANMLALVASMPLTRALACCSFRMTKGRPYSSDPIEN